VLLTVPDVRHPVRWLEWAVGQLAGLPLARSIGTASPRLAGYQVYLGVSRQRHQLSWWQEAARQAGLRAAPVTFPGCGRWPGALRLLTLRPAADEGRPT
jgi:hypothetical protein